MAWIFHLIMIVRLVFSTVPTLLYNKSFNSYNYAAYNDTCKQLKITNNYVFRLGFNNVIEINNKTELQTEARLINYTYSIGQNGSVITPNLIKSFEVDENETFLTIAQSDSTKFLSLMDFQLNSELNGSYYKIIYGDKILGMKHSASGFDQVSKGLSLPSTAAVQITLPTINFTLPNVKNCKCSSSPNNSYLVYWDQYSNAYVFTNFNSNNGPTYKAKILSKLITPNLTQAICFSYDGQYFLMQADDKIAVSIISLNPSNFLSSRSVLFNGLINKAMFLDKANEYIILFNDTAYTLIQTSTLSIVYSRNLSISTDVIQIDYGLKVIYICKDASVDIYNMEQLTTNCSINCMVCSNNMQCLSCITSYQLSNGSCVQSSINNTSLANSTNSTSLTIDLTNNTANSSDAFANKSTLTTNNQTIYYLIMPDGSILVYQITYAQAQIINKTQQALSYTNKGLQKLMVFLTSTPFMFLIIGNLQFFSISSLYIFLNVPMPLDVYNTLRQTIEALSSNLFTTFNIFVNLPALGVQRVDDPDLVELGVSTLFLRSNYQYLILSFGIIIGISIVGWLLKRLQFWQSLAQLIEQNRREVIFGMLLSGLPQFALPFIYIFQQLWSFNCLDRINQSVQLLLIGMIICFAPIFVAVVAYNKKYSSPKKEHKSVSSLQRLWFQRDSIYFIFLNVLFPMLVILAQPLYFLTINLILLLFGLRNAFKSKHFRLNKFMLNLYPVLFHTCFIIFNFTIRLDIIVITQIICLLIYIIGAVHQFITIFYEFVTFVYRFLKNLLQRNKVATTTNLQQKQQHEKQVKKKAIWNFKIQPKKTNNLSSLKSKQQKSMKSQRTIKDTRIVFTKENEGKQQQHSVKLVHRQKRIINRFKATSMKAKETVNISLVLRQSEDSSSAQTILRTYQ